MSKLAIIGSGIAGMSAAYFLKDDFEVTVFEENDYIGGHTNTIDVHDGQQVCPLDTGFMVFNEKTYPNLLKLFNKLDVPYKNTDMSFSVRNDKLNLEYNGSSLGGLFSQKKNIFNLNFLKMIKEILKFNSHAPTVLADESEYKEMSIGQYLKSLKLSEYFLTNFLAPMSSAVWSTPMELIKDFPAKSLVRFFYNHGFVGVNTQLQWKTVEGGSREYRDRLVSSLGSNMFTSCGVKKISQHVNQIEVTTASGVESFDKVIVCTHADEALKMIDNPTKFQIDVLNKFQYQENTAVVHTDSSVMPHLSKNWSSWNFLMREDQTYTVYYMNMLQGVSDRKDFFVNINGESFIDPDKVIKTITYHHPIFDVASMKAQERLDELNTQNNLHFSGSYYRYGFHEDALLSSVNLCETILGRKVL
jgi:uncharacterized protein